MERLNFPDFLQTIQSSLRNFHPNPWSIAGLGLTAFVLVVTLLDFLNYQRQRQKLGDVPIVGDAPYLWRRLRWTENESNFGAVIQRGYDTFSKNGKAWAYWGQHDDFILVVPPGVCDEVKNADLDKLSFLQAVEDSYHFRLHTYILGRSHVDAVRQSVNKNMNQLHEIVVRHGDEVIPQILDNLAAGGKPFPAFLNIWHLVHTVAVAFLIGPHFASNAEYMKEIEDYCLNVPSFVHLYFWIPSPLRLPFWHLSPQGARVRAVIKRLKAFILPELRRTIAEWRQTQKRPRTSGEEGYTLLGAMLDLKEERGQITRDAAGMSRREEERQLDIFADEVIFTSFDSAGPVACLVTQMLFEAIGHAQQGLHLVEDLRAEIKGVLAKHGGKWTPEALSSMPRLESFTRETLRVDGPTLFSVTRSVLQPMQLKSSGLSLRPGTIISTPSWLIHNDEANYPGARVFDPYRFYDGKTNTATTRATTASGTFLAYGYGSQMCPGRFLGVRMTQILFAKILMRYDCVFEGGKPKPENIFMPGQVLPPYQAEIVMRRRQ